MRLAVLVAIVLVLGACAPGTALPPDDYDWGWNTDNAPTAPVLVPSPDEELPPITLDPVLPPVVLPPAPPEPPVTPPEPPVGPPEVIDPPPSVDPPVTCRVRILPLRSAVERITKCPGEPARITRRR